MPAVAEARPSRRPASLAEMYATLNPESRERLFSGLSQEEREHLEAQLKYDWRFWARSSQIAPDGDWRVWLIKAGRGAGKTRSGAEWVREGVETKQCKRVALVGPTAADTRDVMVEGESGILAISPPWFRPQYEPSKRRLTWPNGAMATTYSADEPERLRGPQHDRAWADELAAWRYAEAWDQLLFGLRLGSDPRVMITTTPKPIKIIKDLMKDSTCIVTGGSTFENIRNLAKPFVERIVKRYEGTRLGRQELYAEIIDEVPGALWKRAQLEYLRIPRPPLTLARIVVSIDPAVTAEEDSNETGIVVAGIDGGGRGFVLDDLSGRHSPNDWARIAIGAYYRYQADRIVAETNNGGDLVESTLRTVDQNVSYKGVRASRGKVARAEPVAALYEQSRFFHVGYFSDLEEQMCNWLPGMPSPDRLDALVWAGTELFGLDMKAEEEPETVKVW